MNSSTPTSTRISMLAFTLGACTCCIPASKVVTVFQKDKIIALPRPRPAIEGMIQHQSRLVPLLDLEALLGGRKAEKNFIVIVDQSGFWFALLTGNVDTVAEVDMSQVHCPTPGECAFPPGYVRAIVQGGDTQYVLNLETINNYMLQV